MEANELRTGNYAGFLDPVMETTLQIKSIIPEKGTHELYIGIPLTEEWLLKFGFDNVGDNDFIKNNYKLNNFEYEFSFNEKAFISYGEYGEYHIIGECEYVHQLQNLYFALTGQELTTSL